MSTRKSKTPPIPAKMPGWWVILVLISTAADNYAQNNCAIMKDSITAGSRATSFSSYQYDGQRLVKIIHTDSGHLSPTGFDTIFYNGAGQYAGLERNRIISDSAFLYYALDLSYNADQLARINTSGDNGQPWTLSYDLGYDGNGKLRSIVLDPLSVTGNPDGFKSDLFNLAWDNENIISADITLGGDTVGINVTYDNRNNLAGNLPAMEIPDFLEASSANNITQIVTTDDAIIGPAGTVTTSRSYTYRTDNDVETVTTAAAAFREPANTTRYFYDCPGTSEIAPASSNTRLKVIPNPADDYFIIKSPLTSGILTITDITGREIIRQEIEGISFMADARFFRKAVYFIELTDGRQMLRGKVLKR